MAAAPLSRVMGRKTKLADLKMPKPKPMIAVATKISHSMAVLLQAASMNRPIAMSTMPPVIQGLPNLRQKNFRVVAAITFMPAKRKEP